MKSSRYNFDKEQSTVIFSANKNDSYIVEADREKLKRAVINTVQNSMKYMDKKQKEIQVRLSSISDEVSIAKLERDYLELNDYESDIATTGEAGIRMTMTNTYSLILLDLMLPGSDGFELCKQLRGTLDIPIIMATARKEDIDKILGFDRGADDYYVFFSFKKSPRFNTIIK